MDQGIWGWTPVAVWTITTIAIFFKCKLREARINFFLCMFTLLKVRATTLQMEASSNSSPLAVETHSAGQCVFAWGSTSSHKFPPELPELPAPGPSRVKLAGWRLKTLGTAHEEKNDTEPFSRWPSQKATVTFPSPTGILFRPEYRKLWSSLQRSVC